MRRFILHLNIIILAFSFIHEVKAQTNQVVFNGAKTQPVNFPNGSGTCAYTWVNNTPGIGLAASGNGNIPAFTAINSGSAPITATITVTPATTGYAYIVTIGNSITVIDIATNRAVASIPVGSIPYGVSVSPDGLRVYEASFDGTISVIDAATNQVISTIKLSQAPVWQEACEVVVSPDSKRVYTSIFAYSKRVMVIDATTNTVIDSIAVGFGPTGLTVSPDGSRLYVLNSDDYTMSVVNTANDKVIATIPVGDVPSEVRVSPDGKTIYVVNISDNTLTVYDAVTYALLKVVPVGPRPSALAVSPDGSKVFVTNSGYGIAGAQGTVSVINSSTLTVIATINVGPGPSGISITPDGKWVYVADYGSDDVSVIDAATNQVTAIVNVAHGPEAYGNFINAGAGCLSAPVSFTIMVYPNSYPIIKVTGIPPQLQTTYGAPSASASFTVSGINITGGVLAAPPPGFEVSINNINFNSSVTLPATVNNVPAPLFIRLLSTTPAGPYAGNLLLSSPGAASDSSATVYGTVNPAPLKVVADNKTRGYGLPNPVFTVNYTGFVNNEGIAQLISPVQPTTTATLSSPIGNYPITPAGGVAPNYIFKYVPAVLTITEPIAIPNAFTPNGDGTNDTWNIKDIENYPRCTVYVYNRYGSKVYSSTGYPVSWDGKYNGAYVPPGTYYYVINLNDGYSVFSGPLSIIR